MGCSNISQLAIFGTHFQNLEEIIDESQFSTCIMRRVVDKFLINNRLTLLLVAMVGICGPI